MHSVFGSSLEISYLSWLLRSIWLISSLIGLSVWAWKKKKTCRNLMSSCNCLLLKVRTRVFNSQKREDAVVLEKGRIGEARIIRLTVSENNLGWQRKTKTKNNPFIWTLSSLHYPQPQQPLAIHWGIGESEHFISSNDDSTNGLLPYIIWYHN